jgi:hypothetical protein
LYHCCWHSVSLQLLGKPHTVIHIPTVSRMGMQLLSY